MKHISNTGSAKSVAWIAFLVAAVTLSSFVFACATPFAALGALAALTMRRREAFVLVFAAWAANQFIGYIFLNYPQTTDSFAWGLMIGLAGLAAVETAMVTRTLWPRVPFAEAVFAFAGAFIAYEAVLYATGLVASDTGGFSPAIVGYVFEVNALAFAGLLVLQAVGRALGMAAPSARAASGTNTCFRCSA